MVGEADPFYFKNKGEEYLFFEFTKHNMWSTCCNFMIGLDMPITWNIFDIIPSLTLVYTNILHQEG